MSSEFRFVMHCETETPLHMGSGRSGPFTDAELRRNSLGEFIIPGTSIAGTIRQTVERWAGARDNCQLYEEGPHETPCQCDVCQFMGNVTPKSTVDNKLRPATRSFVRFSDAVVTGAITRVVDSVALDRTRRTAAAGRKFDYAQILPGAKVKFQVVFAPPVADGDAAEKLIEKQFSWLEAALRMLVEGKIRLGGRTNRGHGSFRLSDEQETGCQLYQRDLTQHQQLLDAICNRDSGWKEDLSAANRIVRDAEHLNLDGERLELSFTIRTSDNATLLIHDPLAAAASGFDASQRMLNNDVELPTSSLVGALRSGAARIVRTISQSVASTDAVNLHCDLLNKPCCDTDQQPLCFLCQLFGNTRYASRLSADVKTESSGFDVPFDHVAIDRFTGGAADQKKFDALAVRNAKFDVALTIDNCPKTDHPWMLGLLLLTLGDLHAGRIRLGQAASRGHGRVELEGYPTLIERGKSRDLSAPDTENYVRTCIAELWKKLGVAPPKTDQGAEP